MATAELTEALPRPVSADTEVSEAPAVQADPMAADPMAADPAAAAEDKIARRLRF